MHAHLRSFDIKEVHLKIHIVNIWYWINVDIYLLWVYILFDINPTFN